MKWLSKFWTLPATQQQVSTSGAGYTLSHSCGNYNEQAIIISDIYSVFSSTWFSVYKILTAGHGSRALGWQSRASGFSGLVALSHEWLVKHPEKTHCTYREATCFLRLMCDSLLWLTPIFFSNHPLRANFTRNAVTHTPQSQRKGKGGPTGDSYTTEPMTILLSP